MNKVYQYCEMKTYQRQLLSPEEALKVTKYTTYRKFNTEDELALFKEEKPIKVSEGYFSTENKVMHGRQGYMSVFYYDKEEASKYLEDNKSMTAFDGKCYSDWLYFDFDPKTNAQSLSDTIIPLTDYLDSNKIKYKLFFSGKQKYV